MSGRAHGPLVVTAQVAPAKLEYAIAAAHEEMARFASEGATEAELELAKSFLIGNFPVQLSTNAAVGAVLTDCLYLERGLDYIERYRQIIEGVTLAQVAEAAHFYAPERLGLVSAGTPATGTHAEN
jgi:zinc protease